MAVTLTHDEIDEKLKKCGDFEQAGEYHGATKHMDVKCLTCGNVWRPSFTMVRNGKLRCPNCYLNHQKQDALNKFNQFYKGQFELVSEFSGKLSDKVQIKHLDCGNISKPKMGDLLKGNFHCKYCVNKMPLSEFKAKLSKRYDGQYVYLSGYNGSNVACNIKHLPCGSVRHVKPVDLITGKKRKCRICMTQGALPKFIQQLEEKYHGEYVYVSGFTNSYTKCKVMHTPCQTTYEATPFRLVKGLDQCQTCVFNDSKTNFLKRLQDTFNGEYTYVSGYKAINEKCLIRHNVCGQAWEVRPGSVLSGHAHCPYCSRFHEISKDEFLEKLHTEGHDHAILLGKYNGFNTTTKFRCHRCNSEYEASPRSVLRSKDCPNCKGRISSQEYLEKVHKYWGSKYTVLTKYTRYTDRVKVKCNVCGNIWNPTARTLIRTVPHPSGCPKCSASYMEHKTIMYLNRHKINYEYPKKFKDLKDSQMLHYDFWLPDYNLLLELQGEQHFTAFKCFGGEPRLKTQKGHDQLKLDYAKRVGKSLIRISFSETDNIVQVLNNLLQLVTRTPKPVYLDFGKEFN